MIPTVLLAATIVGRWWMLPACAVAWVGILLAVGTLDRSLHAVDEIVLAAGLSAVNAAAGVIAHRVAVGTFRQINAHFR